jgi:hypothetical protein
VLAVVNVSNGLIDKTQVLHNKKYDIKRYYFYLKDLPEERFFDPGYMNYFDFNELPERLQKILLK